MSQTDAAPIKKLYNLFAYYLDPQTNSDFVDIYLGGEKVHQVSGFDGNPDEGVETLMTSTKTALQDHSATINDVTHAVATSTAGRSTSWDDVGNNSTTPTNSVNNPRERLRAVFEYIGARQSEATEGEVLEHIPIARFYAGGSELPYTIYPPANYDVSNTTESERAVIRDYANDHDHFMVDGMESESRISMVFPEWTTDTALSLTTDLLSELYDVTLEDLTHVEITSSGPEGDQGWTEI